MENQARMEVAAGSEEELKALVAWPIFQEIKELRQDLRTDRDRTDSKIEALRKEVKEDIAGLRRDVKEDIDGLRRETKEQVGGLRIDTKEEFKATKEEFAALHNELKGLKNDFRRLLGGVITILVPIAVAVLRLAFK